MGCFNQSCNLTHVDINDNDVCMMLPILSTMNDGSFRFFKPFCLPIVGIYNHYGIIENIKRDRNVELIEKYFEIPIESFIQCIAGRCDMYGSDSVIQKFYGKGAIALTVEDLSKIHFTTGEDKIVTHPHIIHINKLLNEKYQKEGKIFIPIKIYWFTENEIVIEQMDYKGDVYKHSIKINYKGGELYAGNNFLQYIYKTYNDYCEKYSYYIHQSPFIFGIPTIKQDKAYILLRLTRSFIRVEAYKKIAKTFKKINEKYRERNTSSTDWAKKGFDEYVEAVNQWKTARAIQEKYKGKTDVELTPDEVKERRAFWITSFDRDGLWRDIISPFKATYTGEEFLEIYGDVLLDEHFIELFREFRFVEQGMIAANVMIYDNHSLEQHGDIEEQIKYLKICLDVANKVKKQRCE